MSNIPWAYAVADIKARLYWLGLVLVSASALAWSLTGFFTRLIPLDMWTTLFWRGAFGGFGVLLYIIIVERKQALHGFGNLGKPGWLLVFFSSLGMVSFIASLKLSSVAHVSIIYGVVPFVAAGLAYVLLREVPSRSAVLASCAALAGVVFMVGASDEGTLLGDAFAFMMTLCMAIIMVIARRWPGIPMLHAACVTAVVSAVIALPFAHPLEPAGVQWLNLAAFGLVNSALGLALFAIGSKYLPAIETALLGALDGALAPLWVWLAFAETPTCATLMGGALVFLAVTWHVVHTARGVAKPA
jgi:drug/metabolite transporter (DMT)-like permease